MTIKTGVDDTAVGQGVRSPALSQLETMMVALAFCLFAFISVVPLLRIGAWVGIGHNEGWNAYYALAAVSGGKLYPQHDVFIGNNYPPLSFLVVGLFGRVLGGDYVLAGRLLSLASLLSVSCNIFIMARWTGADRISATLGTAAFLMMVTLLTPEYIGQDDPQLLGQALMTSGAVVFLHGRATAGRMTMAAGLVLAGGLVKHNLLALPLALCCWAAIYDRYRLALFVGIAAVVGLCAVFVLYAVWGQAVFDSVLQSSRVIDWDRMVVFMQVALIKKLLLAFVLMVGTVFVFQARRHEVRFIAIYLVASAIIGFPMLSGAGINFNVLFDFAIALAIGTAAAVSLVGCNSLYLPGIGTLPHPLMLPAVAIISLQAGIFFATHPNYYNGITADENTTSALVAVISTADGPVACENLLYCFWAKKPQQVDFFNYGQRLFTGAASDAQFRERLSNHFYRYVVIDVVKANSTLWPPRLPATTYAWLQAHYVPIHTYGDNILLGPKPVATAR